MKSSLLFLALVLLSLSHCNSKSTGDVVPKECRKEKHRQQLHFTPRAYWMNDPNGMVYYDGEYHLFFQHTPNQTHSGAKYWGHAVSTDLAHWTELDIALSPDEQGDMWSGSAIVDYQNVTGFQKDPNVHPLVAFFTHAGRMPQQQSIAYSLDKGRTFTKYAGNPVIPNPGIGDFRDPKVLKYDDETWVAVIASGDRLRFYSSRDLKNWEPTSDFGSDPSQGNHAGTWECPDLLRFVDEHGYETWVVVLSNNDGYPNGGGGSQYFVGSFDGVKFQSEQKNALFLDWGFDQYAGVTFYNEPKDRKILMGWMTNYPYENDMPTQGYKGQFTIPRTLSLVAVNGHIRLRSEVTEEFLTALRNPQQVYTTPTMLDIAPNAVLKLNEQMTFSNQLLEVDLAFNIHGIKGDSSIAICFLNSFDQELCVGYDNEKEAGKEIFLNRERTGLITGSFLGRATSGRELGDQVITFKVILDVAGVEMFVDGGLTVMEAVFFPEEPMTRIEIRHHARNEESRLTLISGTVQGLNSMYDC